MMDYDLRKSLEQGKYKSAIPVTKAEEKHNKEVIYIIIETQIVL